MDQQLLQCLAQQEEVITLEAMISPLDPKIPSSIWVREATKELQERAVEIERKMDLGLVTEPLADPLPLRLLRACVHPEVLDLIQSFDVTMAITELDQLIAAIRSRITAEQWLIKADKWYALTLHAYEQRTICILHLFAENTGEITWKDPRSLELLRMMVDSLHQLEGEYQFKPLKDWLSYDTLNFLRCVDSYKFTRTRKIILMILDDPKFVIPDERIVTYGTYWNQTELLDFLLKDPRITVLNERLPGLLSVKTPLESSISYCYVDNIKRLLADPRIEINNLAMYPILAEFGNKAGAILVEREILSLIMKDSRTHAWIKTASEDQKAKLRKCLISCNVYEEFKELLPMKKKSP